MIKIYTQNLECVAVITEIISVEWIRRFYDYGSFVLNLPIDCAFLKDLKKNNYIYHNGNIGIILYKEQNKDKIEIRGYDLKGITTFRTCQGELTGSVETVIKDYATQELTTGNKAIPSLRIETNQSRGIEITKTVDLKKLDIVLNEICTQNLMGYEIKKIDNEVVFGVVIPTDRSDTVIFSKRFKNISDYEYIYDDYNEINTVYNLAEIDEVATITEHYKTVLVGLERKETFTTFNEEIEQNIADSFSDAKESISAETLQSNLYNVDWFLGDFVQVIVSAFGETLSVKKQITEITEVYERGNVKIKPIFGEKQENIIKRIIKGAEI